MNIQPIILCGGVGSRLWPISRKKIPKQFLDIFNGKSLFDLTLERIIKLQCFKSPIIIVSEEHKFIVKEKLKKNELKGKILLEPESRNTTGAIYLAASYADLKDTLLIMPADHLIPQVNEFVDIINFSNKNLYTDHWVTFGIRPTNPSALFGYIKVKENKLNTKKIKNFFDVERFIEKPSYEESSRLISSGNYFWNSGIFFAKADFIIQSITKFAPEIVSVCNELLNKTINTEEISFDKTIFKKIKSISIDYSVMEHEKNIKCVQLNTMWTDVGSWDSYINLNINEQNSNKLQSFGTNKIISFEERMIATVGVDNLIIVDTRDATLITTKNQGENLKKLIDENPSINHFKDFTYELRPWGRFDILHDSKICKVKKLSIKPHKRISLQYHNHRSEHWFILSGEASIHLDGEEFKLNAGNSINIKKKSQHFLANCTNNELIVIEIQFGDYFGEEDIIRLDNPYER